MVFVREGFIAKQTKNFETKNAETIYLELIIVKKKWCIIFVYRPSNTNKEEFFDEISVSLNKILGKYHIILADELTINELIPCSDSSKNHLLHMKDKFSLANLTKNQPVSNSRI